MQSVWVPLISCAIWMYETYLSNDNPYRRSSTWAVYELQLYYLLPVQDKLRRTFDWSLFNSPAYTLVILLSKTVATGLRRIAGPRRILSYHRKPEDVVTVVIPRGVVNHTRYPCVSRRQLNIHMLPQVSEVSKGCTVYEFNNSYRYL